ncbi:MAG: hypothetical protein EOP60_00960 [Sphingomonadales bacterium]|nr:MAG: hypothetical protein EOP60_00960 [Sphingomonadales bacterium]
MKPTVPTDPAAEQANGRTALWLDSADLEWLASFCGCAADASEVERERCARIRFRANAALHKAGVRRPKEDEE